MKCEKCIFAMEQEHGSCKCINPSSDWEGSILFEKYDGCREGKTSTVGIDFLQRVALMKYEGKQVTE